MELLLKLDVSTKFHHLLSLHILKQVSPLCDEFILIVTFHYENMSIQIL